MNSRFTCKNNRPYLVFATILLGLVLSSALPAETPPAHDTKAVLTTYGQALAKHNRVLGTWALYEGDEAVFKQTLVPSEDGSGIVIEDQSQPHHYKIGSISKTLTAVLTFKMIEAGRLALDTPLADFYPDIANAQSITIGQMLNHHSGIASYTDQEDFMAYFQSPQTAADMVSRIEALSPAFAPGEKAAYSNSNFLLLGYILEQISGQSYADLVTQHIIEPLNLSHTYVGKDSPDRVLKSYQWNQDDEIQKWQVIPPWSMSVAGAAGAIISTADDMNRFFRGLFKDKLISADSRKNMIEISDGFGHGIFKTKFPNDEQAITGYWHNGGIEGFASHVTYYPEADVTTVVFSNGLYKSSANDLNRTLMAARQGDSLANDIAAFSVKAEQLKPYTGYFQSPDFPLDIEISLIENQLLAQATGQSAVPLTPSGKLFVYRPADIEISFNADASAFTLTQQGNRTDFQRNDSAKPKARDLDEAVLKSYTGVYATDNFPLDITVTVKDGQLFAQATGQGAFPLSAQSDTEFVFSAANITMVFDADAQSMTFSQMGRSFEMQKKE